MTPETMSSIMVTFFGAVVALGVLMITALLGFGLREILRRLTSLEETIVKNANDAFKRQRITDNEINELWIDRAWVNGQLQDKGFKTIRPGSSRREEDSADLRPDDHNA